MIDFVSNYDYNDLDEATIIQTVRGEFRIIQARFYLILYFIAQRFPLSHKAQNILLKGSKHKYF
jgi:hypothetical protein